MNTLIENKNKVWIFTFEYAGVIKVGGLGEVPANQAKHLSKEFDITVFMPSHGQIDILKDKYEWEQLPYTFNGRINATGFGGDESDAQYQISFYKFKIDKVNVILVYGKNDFASKYLDDNTVYNPDTIKGKICLFTIAIRKLTYFYMNDLPDIIHMHDHHVVLAYIGLKQIIKNSGIEIPSIITIHLMTWPRFYLDFYRLCGIDDNPISVKLSEGYESLTIEDIFHMSSNGEANPPVERIGAIVSDLVTTVSESYLISDIIPNCGRELIDFKVDFLWDGCDWDYFQIYESVLNAHGKELREYLNLETKEIKREHLKKYLLEYKMGHLNQSPLINSKRVLDAINEVSNGNCILKNGNVCAFTKSGPLVLTTGRISPQKGFETIFEAIPDVLEHIPSAKFLFLILPTDYSIAEIKSYSNYAKKYPENVKIIFGVASDIFFLAHLSADVYCALSRWEPFGIMALEAMAAKIPIIATKTGGLNETIIDMRLYPEIGTGILIDIDNQNQFAKALISIFKALEVTEKTEGVDDHVYKTDILNLINEIPDEIIKSRILLDSDYYNKIKENCYKRVKEHFTWEIVSRKLSDLYIKLING